MVVRMPAATMGEANKRVMLVAPSSADRTDLAAALLDFGLDVVLADDAGRALRELGDGVDVLIIHREERKLACESLARLAASKKAGLRLFALGSDALWKTSIEASPLPASGSEAAAELAKQLGIQTEKAKGPTLTAEALLWASPRNSVQLILAKRDGEPAAYLRALAEWSDEWRDAFIAALKKASACGAISLEMAWIDDAGINAISPLRPGRSLLALLEGQTLSFAEAAPIMRAVVVAMDKMHRHAEPLLFGPLSPGQVWIDGEGVRLLFGGATRIAYNYDRSLRGRAHQPLPIPLSAEELSGAGGTPASDVFHAAALLYQLLTGQAPYPASAGAQAHQDAVKSGTFRDIHVYAPGLDGKVASAINAALSAKSDQRPTLAEFALLLR
jgi:hypothetical protein